MIGIEASRAELKDYLSDYKKIAMKTIKDLNKILGTKVIKIEHVGSTAIVGIKSKPIIDIVIGIDSFDIAWELKMILENNGYLFSKWKLNDTMMAFKLEEGIKRTHNIYIVLYNGERWKEFVWFRDYLNRNAEIAKEYEKLKMDLASKYSSDIHKYTEGKAEFISNILIEVKKQI